MHAPSVPGAVSHVGNVIKLQAEDVSSVDRLDGL